MVYSTTGGVADKKDLTGFGIRLALLPDDLDLFAGEINYNSNEFFVFQGGNSPFSWEGKALHRPLAFPKHPVAHASVCASACRLARFLAAAVVRKQMVRPRTVGNDRP